jgi:hypothetical protein
VTHAKKDLVEKALVETLEQYDGAAMFLEAVMEVRCRCSNFNDPSVVSWVTAIVGTMRTGYPCVQAPVDCHAKGRSCIRAPPHSLQRWIPPPSTGGLRRCHVSCSFRPCLPAWEGSGATTCPASSNPTTGSRGLQHCHVSLSFGPHLPTREGYDAVARPAAPDLTPSYGRAPTLPRVPWHSAGCGL